MPGIERPGILHQTERYLFIWRALVLCLNMNLSVPLLISEKGGRHGNRKVNHL